LKAKGQKEARGVRTYGKSITVNDSGMFMKGRERSQLQRKRSNSTSREEKSCTSRTGTVISRKITGKRIEPQKRREEIDIGQGGR